MLFWISLAMEINQYDHNTAPQLYGKTFTLIDYTSRADLIDFLFFRRRERQVLVSVTTRHTHYAVVVVVQVIIFRKAYVLLVVIRQKGNVDVK